MESLPDLRTFLSQPRDIVLIGHRNPDGDAIGATLGMRRYLEGLSHRVTVLVPSDYPEFLGFLDGVEETLVFDKDAPACEAAIANAELIGLLDFNSIDRIDKLGELVLAKADTPRFLIDHHLYPEDMAQVTVSDTTASSTCELVFRTIKDMGDRERVTPYVVEPLLTGVLTDTGGFAYATSARLFREVAEMFDIGVDFEALQTALFSGYTEKQMRILGHCLANRMEVFPERKAGLITLTKRDYEQFEIQRGDTEGIVNQMLRIQGIDLAAFITEQPNIVKLSLRSRGDIDVQAIASEHFKGGGHKNAAGGHSYSGLRNTVTRFKQVINGQEVAAVEVAG